MYPIRADAGDRQLTASFFVGWSGPLVVSRLRAARHMPPPLVPRIIYDSHDQRKSWHASLWLDQSKLGCGVGPKRSTPRRCWRGIALCNGRGVCSLVMLASKLSSLCVSALRHCSRTVKAAGFSDWNMLEVIALSRHHSMTTQHPEHSYYIP